MSEEIRFYKRQQRFSADEELTGDKAQSLRSYVRAYLLNGKVERAETILSGGRIALVVYYEQIPTEELVNQHKARYEGIRFQVWLPRGAEGERFVDELYEYDGDGTFASRVRFLVDAEDLPFVESRYDRNNALYETVEYEYDENGDVGVVRSRAPDGTIIHEDRPPLSD